MMDLRPAKARGHASHGWLDSRHSFSFADYYDPEHMGFRDLRVINEDRVQPGQGFPTHPHRNMEIISYVLEGALSHRDSMGNGSIIRPGEVQRMSAGTGVQHSEVNPSGTEVVHFLQIWLLPAAQGLAPSYEQKNFPAEKREGRLLLVASPDGADDSIVIHAKARLYAGTFAAGDRTTFGLDAGRYAWVQLARGNMMVNETLLEAGDGAAISEETTVTIEAVNDSEILLFDLA